MFMSNVPKYFWGGAIFTACYLINHLPTRVLNNETPLNHLLKSYPFLSRLFSTLDLKVFGCTAFIHTHDSNHSKLDPRSLKHVCLGYSPTKHGYQCHCPKKRKYYTSMDVTFFENQSLYLKKSLQGEFE